MSRACVGVDLASDRWCAGESRSRRTPSSVSLIGAACFLCALSMQRPAMRGHAPALSALVALLGLLVALVLQPAWTHWTRTGQRGLETFDCSDGAELSSLELSVVIPAYNEELRLRPMVDAAVAFLDVWRQSSGRGGYELVVVDDGSTDGTVEEVRRIQRSHGGVRVCLVSLGSNQGKGAAVRQGVRRASGEYVLMADADGATDIGSFDALYREMRRIEAVSPVRGGREGVVVGSRCSASHATALAHDR